MIDLETIEKVNDMGVSYEVSPVATMDDYVIYTDFKKDNNGELCLYVGKMVQKKLVDVSLEEYDSIMRQFCELEKHQFGLNKKGDYYEL